jgi:transposase-like protein
MENKRTRRKFSADFKTKVVVEALRERDTVEAIARKYELHPNQITTWKKEFLENASAAFTSDEDRSEEKKQVEAEKERLYSQIGQLKVELDWLKKKWQELQ